VSDTLTALPGTQALVQHRHLTNASQLDQAFLERLLGAAARFDGEPGPLDLLAGRTLATIFYEPSTRTRFSFEAAMYRLGGQVLSAESAVQTSSAAKGESLADTVRIVGGYADAIALRHPEVGAADRAAAASSVPIINAGDGAGQHPTQALLDVYTIKKELGRVAHLRVGLAGDLRHGRTARSLAILLAQFPGIELVLISPPSLRLGEDVRLELTRLGATYREVSELGDAVAELDVLYQTRIQAERFASLAEYERVRDVYVVDPDLMRRLPDHALLMHPLPRLGEIDPAVDADPRAAYFRQARNGVPVRMAVLQWVFAA
jgi:aspartate carbamoyltransferase catalytic subunit